MRAEWKSWFLFVTLAVATCSFVHSVYVDVTYGPLRHVEALLDSPTKTTIKRILIYSGESIWHLQLKEGGSDFPFRVSEAQEDSLLEELAARGVTVDVVCSGSTIMERLQRRIFQSADSSAVPSASNFAPAIGLLALWMMCFRLLPVGAGSRRRL